MNADGSPLRRTLSILQRGIEQQLHIGAQLYVSHRGTVLADVAIGESRADVPMSPETINPWMSSVKPIVAVAVAQLWQHGLLDLDDRVARHIPEFGVRGKEPITIRHLLTHTGGFRAVIGLQWNDPFQDAVAKVCETPQEPRWVPGRTAGYNPNGAWYILAELLRRLDGRPIDEYVREAIFLPLGMHHSWLGIRPEVYRAYGRRIGYVYDTSTGEVRSPKYGNTEDDAAVIRPGANGRGPIRELARFYEALLHKDKTRLLLMPQTIEAMVARHRAGMFDLTFKHVIDWGLGFIIDSNQYGPQTLPYGYGPHASPRTFGHSGHQSSCAFCDPDNALVVAWFCNGMPGEARHNHRQRQINQAIYEDLGLVPGSPRATDEAQSIAPAVQPAHA
ncbi:serine hydrolase domain-containing protein [Fontivita pretiosa]|uniref:serine hydrolase domain-containing protein n=1 Tax=Fontivita pretiosa TaxID=2989684 RepID=UPI003D16E633